MATRAGGDQDIMVSLEVHEGCYHILTVEEPGCEWMALFQDGLLATTS